MISLIQTAEGALNETHSILQRMRELVVQAGNTGTQETEDLQAIQDELNSLIEEIGGVQTGSPGISDRTQFNGKNLLNGDFADTKLRFQIGANQGQQLEVNINDMSASALGVNDVNVMGTPGQDAVPPSGNEGDPDYDPGSPAVPATAFSFDDEVKKIDDAIKDVSTQRSALGAVQNRLEHTINNLSTSSENLTAAESRIRDVDYTEAA